MERRRITVTGIVQGVGFRPFVYTLAEHLALTGFVSNDSLGVTIEIEGAPPALDQFATQLTSTPPPLAHIETLTTSIIPTRRTPTFTIQQSQRIAGESTPVSPDIATCPDCLRELLNPHDRRHRYPFINCTNCGPRFTITRDVPYDRPLTTMASFAMCKDCEREYHDPHNRRFHAQPNACPACGPRLQFLPTGALAEAALQATLAAIKFGHIVAIKGIGGFHLACDATNTSAIEQLRLRKGRIDKPFALMVRSLDDVRRYADVSDTEAILLESRERPIVLLRRRENNGLPDLIAPGNAHLGFFLPYSPLHYLLAGSTPLVMTSGNRSDEPIARDNAEALNRLDALADCFLLHDREIHVVCDDSVTRVFESHELPIRRSRGYAPSPLRLTASGPSVLAVGGELKATFCLTKNDRAYLSQHIGDMENLETLHAFERSLQQMRALFHVDPQRIACDLHPGYLSTRWARKFAAAQGLPLVEIQHHHAHIAALLAEHGLSGPIIGVSFDGTGYGTDGAAWGGEWMLADLHQFERLAHLQYVPLPGGDAAVRKPYRMALAHLHAAGIAWDDALPCVAAASSLELRTLAQQLDRNLNCVPTSSAGRLFDAAASLCGIRHTVNYEAQGAMEFEAIAAPACRDAYTFDGTNPAPVWRAMIDDLRQHVPIPTIAARFHGAVANVIVSTCLEARQRTAHNTVGLSGGVFQNVLLLSLTVNSLQQNGFEVLTHRIVPPNDGGLALGQAAIAVARA